MPASVRPSPPPTTVMVLCRLRPKRPPMPSTQCRDVTLHLGVPTSRRTTPLASWTGGARSVLADSLRRLSAVWSGHLARADGGYRWHRPDRRPGAAQPRVAAAASSESSSANRSAPVGVADASDALGTLIIGDGQSSIVGTADGVTPTTATPIADTPVTATVNPVVNSSPVASDTGLTTSSGQTRVHQTSTPSS